MLERVLGHEVGGWVQRRLEERGVEVHGGDELARFEAAGSGERVGRVVSAGGLSLDCGCVAIGAGVAPDVMLARSAGLSLGELGGIACSASLETSVPGIYAAGDVAEWESALHGGPALVEHFEVAVGHGRVAALNMLGGDVAYDEVPYFWSDLADWATLEYVGVGVGEAVIRGSLDDGAFTAFYLDSGRVVGAVTNGRSADLDDARRMIRAGTRPAPEALADEGTDLAGLQALGLGDASARDALRPPNVVLAVILGQRIARFSSRLSSRTPLRWWSSRVIGRPRQSRSPHYSHESDLSPASISRRLRCCRLTVLPGPSHASSGVTLRRGTIFPPRRPFPRAARESEPRSCLAVRMAAVVVGLDGGPVVALPGAGRVPEPACVVRHGGGRDPELRRDSADGHASFQSGPNLLPHAPIPPPWSGRKRRL